MTKKHFIAFAQIIRADLDSTRANTKIPHQVRQVESSALYAATVFARVARECSPAFDEPRFMKACGVHS